MPMMIRGADGRLYDLTAENFAATADTPVVQAQAASQQNIDLGELWDILSGAFMIDG